MARHSSLTTTFLAAVETLVPVPITFCVVPARAATGLAVVAVGVAERPRTTVFDVDVVAGVAARGAVRAPAAARAATGWADAVVLVVAVPAVRPRRCVGVAASDADINPAINIDKIAIFLIDLSLLSPLLYHPKEFIKSAKFI